MDTETKLATAWVKNIKVNDNSNPFIELENCGKYYYKKYKDTPPGSVPNVENARNLFKQIGIDPTKRRPSSEALLRRALKQKGFPRINNLVDIGNWCSLEFLLPVCVYDRRKIKGRLSSRIGSDNDGYIAIDGKHLDLSGRYLVFDEMGPIGSPIKDSMRTRVTEETSSAVLLIYSPSEISDRLLDQYLNIFIARVEKYCQAVTEKKEILKVSLQQGI